MEELAWRAVRPTVVVVTSAIIAAVLEAVAVLERSIVIGLGDYAPTSDE
jgi:hypothetical protein